MSNRISVGISMEDKEYADALARSLADKFDVVLSLDNYTETSIFITDKAYITGPNVLHISSDKETDGIYKFEGARRIEKHIIHTYCNVYDDYVRKAEVAGCSIIGVCSPYGGAGCTTVAVSIARSLSDSGKKTLFISLDDIPYEGENSSEAVISINRLLFILKDREYDLSDLDSCIWKDGYGLSHLKYMKPYNLLNHIEPGDLQRFISQLTDYYEYVVIDLGSRVGMLSDAVLEICNDLISVTSYGEHNMKEKVFTEHISDAYKKKEHLVINRVNEDMSGCDYDMVFSVYDNPETGILMHLQEVIQ